MLDCVPSLFRFCKTPIHSCSMNGFLRSAPSLLNKLNTKHPTIFIPSRTTMILKRRYPVSLYKEGNEPKLRRRSNILDLVEDTDAKREPSVDVVLTSRISGVGNPGDIITTNRTAAYHKFLLPGLAGYATPELLEYSKMIKKDVAIQEKMTSPSEEFSLRYLQVRCISVVMNKETEWTVEPWHVRASFRKAGVHVLSDSCIQLPPHPISGPNLDLEGKEFYVTVTINKKHKVKVRCRLHHWSTNIADRLPYSENKWTEKHETIFPVNNNDSDSTALGPR